MERKDWHEDGPHSVTPHLDRGTSVRGVIACCHDFGVGVFIPAHDQHGHVPPGLVRNSGQNDPPPLGTEVTATVLGYDQQGRLLLSTRLRDLPGMWRSVDELPTG